MPILSKLLAVAVAAGLLGAVPAHGRWREASSDNFLIYSEAGAEELREYALRLERFHYALGRILKVRPATPGPASRLAIFSLNNLTALRNLGGSGAGTAGYYIGRSSGSIAVTARNVGPQDTYYVTPENVLFHELAHHFIHRHLNGVFPAWYSEGFAEFASAPLFTRDGAVRIGAPPKHFTFGFVYGDGIPLKTLFSARPGNLTPEQTEAFYRMGWLLTHYLTFEPSRAGQLARYLARLRDGVGSIEAAQEAFGDFGRLGLDLEGYINKSKSRFETRGVVVGEVAVRDLSPAEEAVMQLRMRSARGMDTKEAGELLPQARRIAASWPADPAVQVVLAEVAYTAGAYGEAEAAAGRAMAADPRSVKALLLRGQARGETLKAAKNGAASEWEAIRSWFRAAGDIDPQYAEPLIQTYYSYGGQRVAPTEEAVAGMIRAQSLAPQDEGLRWIAGGILLQDGKGAEARAMLAPLGSDPHGSPVSRMVSPVIAAIDSGGAAAALAVWQSQSGRSD